MNRIGRLEVELRVDDTDLADELSTRVSRLHATQLAPTIDRICTEASPGDIVDRIESLELDLGVLPLDDFEGQFVERLAAALREAIARSSRHAERMDVNAALELLETFALTGALPWWAETRDREVVARAFARAAFAAERELVAFVRRVALDAGALERIAQAADHGAVMATARHLGLDETRSFPTELVARRTAVATIASTATVSTPPLTSTFVSPSGSANSTSSARSVIESSASSVSPSSATSVSSPIASSVSPSSALTSGTNTRVAFEPTPGQPRGAPPTRPRDPLPETTSDGATSTIPRHVASTRAERLASNAHAALTRGRRAVLARLDEIYIDNAGLVILWPFLARFFTRIGLVDENHQFTSETATIDGIAVLAMLAFPDAEPLEFQVPLVKLLCGRPLESDFVLDELPSIEHRNEAEHLLAAVIDHIELPGQVSSDGFRRSFLQRRAALTTRDGAWLLQVEQQPHDVALRRAPWSWSWIKLPWMPNALRVEW